jgi:diaminopimelate epimerase
MMLSVAKAHAYGNDFLFIPLDQVEGADLPALAQHTCARHTGIGADGLILYASAPDGTARMRLLNADGSPSELSGNGLRCLAALLVHQREQRHEGGPLDHIDIETDAGWKRLALVARSAERYTFRAAMGEPENVRQEELTAGGESLVVATLTMGNPQCVALVDELPNEIRFHRLGSALSKHIRFPAGTNVEFAAVEAPNRVRIMIWERGVGPTHASGTGACASAVAAIAFGGANRNLDVVSSGGTQRVEWHEDGVYLTGWAEILFDGTWIPHADPAPGLRGR